MNNSLTLNGCQAGSLFSHMALYGLASIVEDSGQTFDIRMRWSRGSNPRPVVDLGPGTADHAAEVVRDHAAQRADASSWVQQRLSLNNAIFGLFSPRVKLPGSDLEWQELARARRASLDTVVTERGDLDCRLIGALGEPGYWRRSKSNELRPDEGASRFEMQPRNRGSEFVGNRLSPLARAVGSRKPGTVLSGLTGASCTDEVGKNQADSRTATGFAQLGPVDNALAWCAMWGIAMFPVALRIRGREISTGNLRPRGAEYFFVPVWTIPLRAARLRTILVSGALRNVAARSLVVAGSTADELAADADWSELRARGVQAAIRFPVATYGSVSAPERRALEGVIVRPS